MNKILNYKDFQNQVFEKETKEENVSQSEEKVKITEIRPDSIVTVIVKAKQ